jgi:hypothetical protein
MAKRWHFTGDIYAQQDKGQDLDSCEHYILCNVGWIADEDLSGHSLRFNLFGLSDGNRWSFPMTIKQHTFKRGHNRGRTAISHSDFLKLCGTNVRTGYDRFVRVDSTLRFYTPGSSKSHTIMFKR